jgi:hypothetical protein
MHHLPPQAGLVLAPAAHAFLFAIGGEPSHTRLKNDTSFPRKRESSGGQ